MAFAYLFLYFTGEIIFDGYNFNYEKIILIVVDTSERLIGFSSQLLAIAVTNFLHSSIYFLIF